MALEEWGVEHIRITEVPFPLTDRELRQLLIGRPSLWKRICLRVRYELSELMGEAAYWTDRMVRWFRRFNDHFEPVDECYLDDYCPNPPGIRDVWHWIGEKIEQADERVTLFGTACVLGGLLIAGMACWALMPLVSGGAK